MFQRCNGKANRRRGMTLVELLAVSAIMLLMAGTLGSLAIAVQSTNQFQVSRSLSLQHGQVSLTRLQRNIQEATANASFPGIAVFSATIGSHSFPDTLVVWHPSGTAAAPTGMPRINELVVYCANPSAFNELWEITKPSDTRTAPALSDLTAWNLELQDFRQNSSAVRNVLTDLLRVASVTDANGTVLGRRAVLRFDATQHPSAAQWQSYLGGQTTFDALPWVLGIRGRTTGLAQTQCRFELQLTPGDAHDNRRDVAIPFFGSASLYFDLSQ